MVRVHLLLGLVAGAFLTVLGLTGSIMAFEPELDHLLHRHLSYLSPAGRVLSLHEISDAVAKQFGNEPIVAFLPATSPKLSSQVVLPSGIVCVNQYTGEILGMRTRGQTFLGFVRALHVRLAAGDLGRGIMRWSGVALLVSLVSGLYLWWPIRSVRLSGAWRTWRFWFDLHNATGIVLFLPFLALATTGTAIGFEDEIRPMLDRLTHSAPVPARQMPIRQEPTAAASAVTPDDALRIALTLMPGAVPYRVQMPQYGGVYRVSLLSNDKLAAENNSVAIDPYSGEAMVSTRSTDLSAGERFMTANEGIHTGSALGVPGRIIASLASIILPVQALSGLLLWLRRRQLASAPAQRIEEGEAVA